jgi:hypothetical protein
LNVLIFGPVYPQLELTGKVYNCPVLISLRVEHAEFRQVLISLRAEPAEFFSSLQDPGAEFKRKINIYLSKFRKSRRPAPFGVHE